LPIEEMSSFGGAAFDGKVVSNNGDVLIKFSEQLFHCDNNGKLIKNLNGMSIHILEDIGSKKDMGDICSSPCKVMSLTSHCHHFLRVL
jgi:hypothetical protein